MNDRKIVHKLPLFAARRLSLAQLQKLKGNKNLRKMQRILKLLFKQKEKRNCT